MTEAPTEAPGREAGRVFWELCGKLVSSYPVRSKRPQPESEPVVHCRSLRKRSGEFANLLAPSPHWLGDASVGQGFWAAVPWVAFFDRRAASSPARGVYPVVQLLWKGEPGIRLVLNMSTDPASPEEQRARILEELSSDSLEAMKNLGFEASGSIGAPNPDLLRLPWSYQRSAVLECFTPLEAALRDPEAMTARLEALLRAYLRWAGRGGIVVSDRDLEGDRSINDLSHARDALKVAAHRRGLFYSDGLHESLLLSLKSKPFCILAGPTGTGKSCLARLLEDLGARVRVEPVDAGWADGRPLMGGRSDSGAFELGALTSLARAALRDPGRLHVLVLDEMNLARPERYLAQWLSVVESRRLEAGQPVADPLLSRETGCPVPTPPNLCVIGTLNMDDAEHPIPHRVLDRANVLVFSSPRLLFAETPDLDEPASGGILDARVFSTLVLTWHDVVDAADPHVSEHIEMIIVGILQPTQDALRDHLNRVRISFRLRDEIAAYLFHGIECGLRTDEDLHRLVDQQLRQRLLPKLLDGRALLEPALVAELLRAWEPLDQSPEGATSILRRVAAAERDVGRPVSLWEILT